VQYQGRRGFNHEPWSAEKKRNMANREGESLRERKQKNVKTSQPWSAEEQ